MKKTAIILMMISVFCSVWAINTEVSQFGNQINVKWNGTRGDNSPKILQNFAILSDDVSVVINSMDVDYVDSEGNILRSSNDIDDSVIQVKDYYTLRELSGVAIEIQTSKEVNGVKAVLKNLDYEVIPNSVLQAPVTKSIAFEPIYKDFVQNYEYSYLRGLPYHKPTMLIVSSSNYEVQLARFIAWKEQVGIDVTVAFTSETGQAAADVKNYIQNSWDNGSKYDYVVIVGDEDGENGIASFSAGEENDVTDLEFSLLEGNDYFPELLLGRFSVDTSSELDALVRKSIAYEKEPFTDGGWLDRALVVAGNFSGTTLIPSTPVKMSRWLHNTLKYDYNYANVDTIFYYNEEGNPGTYPGTNEISTSIENGAGIVSYRGWGNSAGWLYPAYDTGAVSDLDNVDYTPLVFSIVCDTGDFGHNNDPCFGEKWMRMGTNSTHKGAVAFVGPSFLHTSTFLNNGLSSGIFHGILAERIRTFGTAVLYGKMELYEQYPDLIVGGGSIDDYFRYYNILSDPSLNMWIHTPGTMTADLPNSIDEAVNFINVDLSVNDFTITALSDNGDEFYAKVEGSHIAIPTFLDATEMTITITKPNKRPIIKEVTIGTITDGVAIVGDPFAGLDIQTGEEFEVSIEAKNYSASDETITAEISTDSEYVTITDSNIDFGTISGNSTQSSNFSATVAGDCPNGMPLEFSVEFSNGSTSKMLAIVHGLHVEVISVTSAGIINPGNTGSITLRVQNPSQIDINGLEVTITDYFVENTFSETLTLGDLVSGATIEQSFDYTIPSGMSAGRPIRFYLDFTDDTDQELRRKVFFTPATDSSVHPSYDGEYGYVAYDNTDAPNPEAPEYNWIEIDPRDGDLSGTVVEMPDDDEVTVDLPFSFKFYGEECDVVTICSNGWIALTDTWATNFRNWNLPAPLAPKNLIAPYWDDLKGLNNGETPMRIVYFYDEANHQFIIEWNDAHTAMSDSNPPLQKLQVILKDPAYEATATGDGEIIFQYHTISNPDFNDGKGNYSTVGIQNSDRTDSFCYSFANIYLPGAPELAAGLAVKFTTDQSDNYTNNDSHEVLTENVNVYPNPFNPKTTISFVMTSSGEAKVSIFDIRGRLVRKLLKQQMEEGTKTVDWNGTDDSNQVVASGIYFAKVTTNKGTISKKMLLLK